MSVKIKEILSQDRHRNGVCGAPFTVSIVIDSNGRNMLIVDFGEDVSKAVGNVVCAAFDLDLLDKRNIEFGKNSWRGDHYYDAINEAYPKEGE